MADKEESALTFFPGGSGPAAAMDELITMVGEAPVVKEVSGLIDEHSTGKEVAVELGASVAGGVAGYLLWKKHPVLGALAGMGTAVSAVDVVAGTPAERKLALIRQATVIPASTAGSLLWKRHPVLGYIAGWLLAAVPVALATKFLSAEAKRERAARAAYDKLTRR